MKYRELIQFDLSEGMLLRDYISTEPLPALAARLVPKTPEQAVLVREHLSKFAAGYGGLSERLDEFVKLFPIHPDGVAILEKVSHLKPADILRWLAGEVEKLLDATVPAGEPGLITYDCFWEFLSRQPEYQKVPEVEAVVHCSKTLAAAVNKNWPRSEGQLIAQRILHALLVHRLTTADIYNTHGLTPAELCDALGLPSPGGDPTTVWPALVTDILGELKKCAGEKAIACHPSTGQYSIHIQKFKRFVKPELILHWVNALPFVLLMFTGAIMLASRFWHFDRHLATVLHEASAAGWIFGLPLTVVVSAKAHWQHLRAMLTWGLDDVLWMTQSFRSVYNKHITPPPAGRFDTGQKINAMLVFIYFGGFSTTGLLMFFKGSILSPWYVHTALFFSALGSTGGHLYLAMLNPSTRIALAGIFHGWAPIEYIKHHHALSLPESARSHHATPGKKTLKEELHVSKAEIIILIITLLLAGVGTLAFNQAQLASVKKGFVKKFADSINPSDLSTRHRIGPLAESCTKCHSYTGQIPDANCEQCHLDIRERRAKGIGYHGTLKDDCRACHKEHPGTTNSIVPFDRDKFDHNHAAFKLEGQHAKVACDECHKKLHPPVVKDAPLTSGIYYIGLKSDQCTDCHRDPHNNQFAAACEKCHTANGWTAKALKFSHEQDASFPLTGKHATAECVKCHKPIPPGADLGSAQFKGLAHDCVSCHGDPHRKQFAVGCETCHPTTSWKKDALTFDHNKDSKYPLVAKHGEVACEKCHVPKPPPEPLASAQFRELPFGRCNDCHQDPHNGQFAQDGCTKCHPTPSGWTGKQLLFDHNRDSQFPLAGKHLKTKCLDCHKPQVKGDKLAFTKFKGLGVACDSCHKVKHPEAYGPTCVSCHTVDRWGKQKVGVDHILKHEINGEQLLEKHLTAKCSACHNPARIAVLGKPGQTQFTCVTCHTAKEDPHKGTLGADCTKCHTSIAWKGESLKFDHNTMTSYGLNQDHKNVACVKCHKDNHWKPVDTSCIGCHPKFGNNGKNGQPAPAPLKKFDK